MDIAYLGEWTWAASLGRLLLALAFTSALASTIGYAVAVRQPKSNWMQLGRWGFRLHASSILATVALSLIHI